MKHFIGLQSTPEPGRLPRVLRHHAIRFALIVSGLLLLLPGVAGAGNLTLYSCHTPSGTIAGTNGWSFSSSNPDVSSSGAVNGCRSSVGSLSVALRGGGMASHTNVAWTLTAPPNTSIVSLSAAVCGRALSDNSHVSVFGGAWHREMQTLLRRERLSSPSFLGCNTSPPLWGDERNRVSFSGLALPAVHLVAGCSSTCAEASDTVARFEISAVKAEIRDLFSPVVGEPTGALLKDGPHAGLESILFDAEDSGVGLFRAVAEVRLDGSDVWRPVAVSAFGTLATCAGVDETDLLYEFDTPQPCPLKVDDHVLTVNHAVIPDGTHALRVYVEDASGNRTDVFNQPRHQVLGLTPVATDSARPARARQQLRFTSSRTWRDTTKEYLLTGTVLDDGSRPAPNAQVEISSRTFLPQPGVGSGPWSAPQVVTTDAQGRFKLRVGRGPSRTFRAVLAAEGTTAELDVRVPAAVSARARSTRVRNGRSAVISGRVAGPVPSGGVMVALEVRDGRRWIPVATDQRWARTRANGAFKLSYRFKRTFTLSRYRFRVVAAEDSAFAYSQGVSRSVDVTVVP